MSLHKLLMAGASVSLMLIGAAAWSQQACAGAAYNPAADFETGFTTQSNPNGVWSYGYSSNFTTPVTLYDQTAQPGINGPNAQYWITPSVNIGESPSAEFNNGPAYDDGNVHFAANQFLLVAGIGPYYSDLVFTAAVAGSYSVVSSFLGDQYGIGTVVGVLVNDVVLFNSSVTAVGQTVPFDTEVSLTAGETVEFSVGPGSGLQNTGLNLTITDLSSPSSIPEPASLALLATGLLGIMSSRLRKRA